MGNQNYSIDRQALNFQPCHAWPDVFPALKWRGYRVSGFQHDATNEIELNPCSSLIEVIRACYPSLGLAELARLHSRLLLAMPDEGVELTPHLFSAYGLKLNSRLEATLQRLRDCPMPFQNWVDEKAVQARDLAPLLALNKISAFSVFLEAICDMRFSKSDGTRALELGVELYLLGRPLNDILPSGSKSVPYLRQLEAWRNPSSTARDREWSNEVQRWPWPAQVKGQWRREGDQTGLDVHIRANSANDLRGKLERLLQIPERWTSKT